MDRIEYKAETFTIATDKAGEKEMVDKFNQLGVDGWDLFDYTTRVVQGQLTDANGQHIPELLVGALFKRRIDAKKVTLKIEGDTGIKKVCFYFGIAFVLGI